MADAHDMKQSHRRLALKLGGVVMAMFAFGYALVPLYDVFCELTGINGKTGRAEANVQRSVDRQRTITVEFMSTTGKGLPWEFRPTVKRMQVHPGETVETAYYARNTANERIVGQAVPSVAPNVAASYFKKIECFCFTQQTLAPGEEKTMPVRYVVDARVPADVHTITLAYTFFNTDKQSAKKYGGEAPMAARHDGHGDAHGHHGS